MSLSRAEAASKDFEVKIVCLTAYVRLRLAKSDECLSITVEIREKLEGLNLKIVEETQCLSKGVTLDVQFPGRAAPSWVIHEFLSGLWI